MGAVPPFPLEQEVVVNLAGAEKNTPHGILVLDIGIVENEAETAVSQFLRMRRGSRMPEQTLRRHHDQGFAARVAHLAAQDMKVLRRRGRVTHLNVVFRAQGEEALEPGARVLGSLSFVPVGEQEDQIARLAPLRFRAGDEIIDDHLGAVGEIAELSLPYHERQRIGSAVAELEA